MKNAKCSLLQALGQEQDVDAAAVCGGADKIARVQVEQTGLDVLLGGLTSGVYTPRTARVYCVK